jgi:O-antigen/teichoic acid export membrane protein
MKVWNNIKKKYTSEFFKYSAVLLSSNAISQVIALIVYPIVTRIYSPGVFGEVTLLLSIVAILSIIPTGKYELAIILPKSEKKAFSLFQLCIILNILFFLVLLVVFSLWKSEIASFFNQEELSSILLFVPFLVLTAGVWHPLNFYLLRKKKYYNISFYNISQSVVNSGLKCFLGIKGFFQSGLLWAALLGPLIGIFCSLFKSRLNFKRIFKIDKAQFIHVAKIYSNFPKFELPHELLNTFAGNLPILLLAVYFGKDEIGLFSLALTMGFRPVNLFSNSVYQVLYRNMSERLHNKEKMMVEFRTFCKTCCFTILPFFILFLFISEWAFGLLFGSEWGEAGFYLKVMLPWLFMVVLVASLSFVPDLFFKQKTAMYIEIIYVFVRVAALLAGIYFNSFRLAVILYCSVSALMLAIKLVWYVVLIKKYELRIENFV